jgi:hypothetical protein
MMRKNWRQSISATAAGAPQAGPPRPQGSTVFNEPVHCLLACGGGWHAESVPVSQAHSTPHDLEPAGPGEGGRVDVGTERGFLRWLPLVPVLASFVFVVAYEVAPTLTLPWWTNTEEFPYAQEVVRFVGGDFHQRFFDIPGTPLMFLASALFVLPRWLIAVSSGDHGYALFSAQMTVLFVIMRLVEAVAYLASGAFVFLSVRRVASRPAAAMGAVVIATSGVVYTTIGYTRIESMAVLLVAVTIYLWIRGLESGRPVTLLAAAVVAGFGMAARFPVGLAAMPVFLLQATLFPQPMNDLRWRRIPQGLCLLYGTIAISGAAIALLLNHGVIGQSSLTDIFFMTQGSVPYPDAFHAIRKIWILVGSGTTLVLLLMIMAKTRSWVARRASGSPVLLIAGFPIGFIVGVPTLFGGANYFLASVNLFLERNATYPTHWTAFQTFSLDLFGSQGFLKTLSLVPFAGQPGALFSPLLLVLLLAGVVVCLHRRRSLFPFIVLGIPLGLISQLGKIEGSRHIAAWMPWFAIVIAIGFDWLSTPLRRLRPAAAGVAISGLIGAAAIVLLLPIRGFSTPVNQHSISKIPAQRLANRWLNAHTQPTDPVLVACCTSANGPVVTNWMRQNGVRVPPASNEQIWFGDKASVEQTVRGYVVLERHEFIGAYLEYYASTNPKLRIDPFTNRNFTLLAHFPFEFGGDIDIFRFDMYKKQRLARGGIHVLRASYAPPCAVPHTCTDTSTGAALTGNWTRAVDAACEARLQCRYVVSLGRAPDPAPELPKALTVEWRCGSDAARSTSLPAEALGRSLKLACPKG